jgi:hypothetical protein
MSARLPAQPIAPSASPEEATAIMAALERFERDTAPRRPTVDVPSDGWARAAILEGVSRQPDDGSWQAGGHSWINT